MGARARRAAVVVVAVVSAVIGVATPAGAAGSLAVSNVGTSTISGGVGYTIVGDLPSAVWADTTGTGQGWNGTVAVSDLSFTGTWAPLGSAQALSTNTSAAYSGTADGISYTVTTGAIVAGSEAFTYTSTDSSDASGSGTAVALTAVAVGTHGLTINFGTLTTTSGWQYKLDAGTEPASAMSLYSSAPGTSITPQAGTTSPSPTFVNSGSTVTGGGPGATAYGTPVKFLSAAVGTGEGSYTVVPGAKIATDSNSWIGTYSAGISYTIASGP